MKIVIVLLLISVLVAGCNEGFTRGFADGLRGYPYRQNLLSERDRIFLHNEFQNLQPAGSGRLYIVPR